MATPTMRTLVSRQIAKKVYAAEQAEGVGARVRRALGSQHLRRLSPFLMMDHFRVGEGAGFADHPHRGQATVTYMLEGYFQHEDFAGHRGVIGPGDIQWMTVGRGMVHAEMPIHYDERGRRLPTPVGIQLWLDLPKHAKMMEPSYQELSGSQLPLQTPRASEPPELEGHGWEIKIISGASHGIESPVSWPENGDCWFLHVRLAPGGWVFQDVPAGWNALLYIVHGCVSIGANREPHDPFTMLVLDECPGANGVRLVNPGTETADAILLAGMPMQHDVVQYGPFVMTTPAEIYEAFDDYQMGRNGFERARGWHSEIARHM